MKMQALKQEVFKLTCVHNTTQLKKERPDLTKGRDLRYKVQWKELLEKLIALREEGHDLSLTDLEASEQMLKDSLTKVGQMAGLDKSTIETDWQRIKLEAQFADIHIDDL